MLKALDHLEEWLIAFLMGAATLLIFVAVAHRYAAGVAVPGLQDALLKVDLSWAQELCIYMFVWVAKFGAAYGVRTGIHVGVDVVVNQLKSPWRNAVVLFGNKRADDQYGCPTILGRHGGLALCELDNTA